MLSNLIDRMKLPFRKDKELYLSLRKIIGFYPHDISYYKLALMHKSMYKRNAKGKPVNNERLEFLGDAVLDATVGDIVYRHFPGKREGFLTNTRSKLVQRDTLNRLAQEMGINQLILSSGRSQSHNSYMGGNAFEALVGAIYLDRGYDACMKFMRKRILTQMINIDKVAYKEVNFKSKLIEWSQKNRVRIDFKSILEEKDKTGSPVFIYRVTLEGVEGCDGKGYSKKESQQLASKLTLEKLRREPQFIDQVFAAKTNRTKMEEEPVENVPSTEQPDDFIVVSSGMEREAKGSGASNGSNSDSDYRGSGSSRNSSDSRNSSLSRNASTPVKEEKCSCGIDHDAAHTSAPSASAAPAATSASAATSAPSANDVFEAILAGKGDKAADATKRALDEGLAPQDIINGKMIRAMSEVGQRFQDGKAFVPQLLMAGRAMKTALEILKPLLAGQASTTLGRIVIGTVKGDLHDIGKNLVASMLEGCGFEVKNIGIDVPSEKFVEAVKDFNADILCMSALLTTTMTYMRDVIKALEDAGIRNDVKVMVGGAPVTQTFADEIGADGYSDNANSAVAKAKELMKK